MHSLKESEKYLLTLTFRFFPARSRTEKNVDRKKKNKLEPSTGTRGEDLHAILVTDPRGSPTWER